MDFMNRTIDNVPNVSIITKIEMLSFTTSNQHYLLLTDFMADATILDLTSSVVDLSIDIRKKYKTKLPDAIIAATAMVYDQVLITRIIPDFKYIQGLKFVNPHSL